MGTAQSLIHSGVDVETLNFEDLQLGLSDFFNSVIDKTHTPELSNEEANQILAGYFEERQNAVEEGMKQAGKKFLEENAKNKDVVTLPSGLQYKVVATGEGKRPNAYSTVTVHYEGRLISGQVFDSSFNRGEPVSFNLQSVIKGWTEGLQLMPVGSVYTFYIPYELAYGEHGTGPIPPYSTLVFDVKLLDIAEK